MKYANFAFALTAAAFGFFILGYTIGVDDGAEQQIDSIRKALADQRAVDGGQLTPISNVTTTCLVYHSDGTQCVSDGKGGYLPRD